MGVIDTKTRRGRVIVAASAAWFLATVVIFLIMLSQRGTKGSEALVISLILNLPLISFWTYQWIKQGKPCDDDIKNNQKSEVIKSAPPLVKLSEKLSLKYEATAFLVLSACVLGTYIWVLVIYSNIQRAVREYGYGNVPLDIIENFVKYEEIAINASWVLSIASAIAFLAAYNRIIKQLTAVGVKGLKTSTWMLIVWFAIPIASLFMPWLALGKVDRATRFAAKYGRGGEVWNMKGVRSFSWRTILMALTFLIYLAVAAGAKNRLLTISIEAEAINSALDFDRSMGAFSDAYIIMSAFFIPSALVSIYYLFSLHRSLSRISNNCVEMDERNQLAVGSTDG